MGANALKIPKNRKIYIAIIRKVILIYLKVYRLD